MTHQLTHPEVHIDVNIPRTWKDVSYKNDALPSWEFGDLQIFIGDTTSTVMEDLNYKYTVILKSQYSCAEPIFESNDWFKTLCFIKEREKYYG